MPGHCAQVGVENCTSVARAPSAAAVPMASGVMAPEAVRSRPVRLRWSTPSPAATATIAAMVATASSGDMRRTVRAGDARLCGVTDRDGRPSADLPDPARRAGRPLHTSGGRHGSLRGRGSTTSTEEQAGWTPM